MAVHQGNNLMGQGGRRVPWGAIKFPNSLLPAVGYGVGSNAFPFLCLLWKIFSNFLKFFSFVPSVSRSQITLQTN